MREAIEATNNILLNELCLVEIVDKILKKIYVF
jgi:hypothetical protein